MIPSTRSDDRKMIVPGWLRVAAGSVVEMSRVMDREEDRGRYRDAVNDHDGTQ